MAALQFHRYPSVPNPPAVYQHHFDSKKPISRWTPKSTAIKCCMRNQVSVDACPVNCIHWVEREELAVLEFLIQPRAKEGYGIFGQGYERPANVFMAAKSFDKQLKQQAQSNQREVRPDVEPETPAQAQARESASLKLKMEGFSRIWEWMKEMSGQ